MCKKIKSKILLRPVININKLTNTWFHECFPKIEEIPVQKGGESHPSVIALATRVGPLYFSMLVFGQPIKIMLHTVIRSWINPLANGYDNIYIQKLKKKMIVRSVMCVFGGHRRQTKNCMSSRCNGSVAKGVRKFISENLVAILQFLLNV